MKGASLTIVFAFAALMVPAWAQQGNVEFSSTQQPVNADSKPGLLTQERGFFGATAARSTATFQLIGDTQVGVETPGTQIANTAIALDSEGLRMFGRPLYAKCSLSPAAAALGFTCFMLDPRDDDMMQDSFVFVENGVLGRLQFGRQNGAGEQFGFSAPSLFDDRNASTLNVFGYDLISTRNTLNSGFDDFAFKMMYATPRVLGAQLAVSYAPNSSACGAIICPTSGNGELFASYGDVVEFGANYFHAFDNGLSLGVSGTYLTAAADTTPATLPMLEDYQSWNLGANVKFSGFTIGASYKQSNLGRDFVDYNAYDVGATYETGSWGFMISYGADASQATGRDSRAFQGGIDYSFTDKSAAGADVQVGAGVQYFEGGSVLTLTPNLNNAPLSTTADDSTVVFLETLVSF